MRFFLFRLAFLASIAWIFEWRSEKGDVLERPAPFSRIKAIVMDVHEPSAAAKDRKA